MLLLENGIYGNPHSTNPASKLSTQLADDARKYVLQYFQAGDEYFCIFTPNASGALKIVGECYPFNNESFLLLSLDNHNSVNGIREFAQQKGSAFQYTPLHNDSLYLDKTALHDFVSISFYKIFGYPTGVGCLLMRKDIFNKVIKPWYAGGTITLSAASYQGHFLKENEERFEDGTINYLNIPAVKMGLQQIEQIGMENIKARVSCLAMWLIEKLSALQHYNHTKMVNIFGAKDAARRGGTIVMNFYNSQGDVIPFWQIEEAANKRNISIRTGCFCNPGLDETNNHISTQDLQHYFGTRKNGDYFEMINVTNKLRGSVRVSLGSVSNFNDVNRFYQFAQTFLDV